MFELPEHPEGKTYVINERIVRGEESPFSHVAA